MSEPAPFAFVACQPGLEKQCKSMFASSGDSLRFAFSRPGCLTYKILGSREQARLVLARNPFARTFGWSYGTVQGASVDECAAAVWRSAPDFSGRHLHCWSRNQLIHAAPGSDSAIDDQIRQIGQRILAHRPRSEERGPKIRLNHLGRPRESVLDCVVLEPTEWLVGEHIVRRESDGWPGGIPPIELETEPVSRAYYKTKEALLWSRMPIRKGDLLVEIGSAPGGSSQALLEEGLRVIGVDPADMDERILADPNFEHWRKRGAEFKRKDLKEARWLTVDTNVAPQHTLDTIGDIVTNKNTNIRGFLATLKMPDWDLLDALPDYVALVRQWGFRYIRTRHLAYNRNELCLFGLRSRTLMRTQYIRKKDGAAK